MQHRSTARRLGGLATVVAASSLLAGLLSGCGGDSPSDAAPSADADVVVHALTKLTFDQSAYTATAGDVIIDYVNDSAIVHNLHVLDGEGNDIGSPLEVVTQGAVDQGTFTLDAGSYTLVCKIAGHGTMTATLTVD